MEGRLLSEIVSLIILDRPTRNFAHCVRIYRVVQQLKCIQMHDKKFQMFVCINAKTIGIICRLL